MYEPFQKGRLEGISSKKNYDYESSIYLAKETDSHVTYMSLSKKAALRA